MITEPWHCDAPLLQRYLDGRTDLVLSASIEAHLIGCADPDAVDDVLQDTFVAVWKGAERWRGDGEVAAWLWGIAARRLVSRLRR